MEFIHIGSSTLIGFFLLLLLSKSSKSQSDWILFIWFVVLLIHTLTFYFLSSPSKSPGVLLELSDSVTFLHGPILWFYTKSLARDIYRLKWSEIWHLLPAIISLSIFLSNFFFFHSPQIEGLREYMTLLKLLLMVGYGIFVLKEIRNHQRLLPQLFSSIEEVNLSWLFVLVIGLLAIWTIAVVSLSLFFFVGIDIPEYGGIYTNLALSIFVFVLGFYGIRQTQIFLRPIKIASENVLVDEPEEKISIKYERSGLNEIEGHELYSRVCQFIKENKIYLDPQLSLARLADQTNVSSHHLSQAINTYASLNFFDFINRYRVEAVKEKLQDPNHIQFTLLAIGLESGFNSKASFNRAFKKFTDMTPSAYRKKLEKNM